MKQRFTAALALACTSTGAQTPAANPTQRLCGTAQSFDSSTPVVQERSGEVLSLLPADNVRVNAVLPIESSAAQAGSYVGAAAVPVADATLRPLEVLLLPEAAHGSGEGHTAYGPQPGSTMTNATIADGVAGVAAADARPLKPRYKGAEKTLTGPAGVPVVTFKPGDRSPLVAGANVLVNAHLRDDEPTVRRALTGRGGFVPPM